MVHNYGQRSCLTCGNSYIAVKNYQKFCTQKCQNKFNYTKSMSTGNQYERISKSWPRYLLRLTYPKGREELTVQDLMAILEKQDYKCAISGVTLTKQLNKGMKHFTNASVDRIIPGGPYTLDNIRLVCRIVNVMKWNMSDAELKEWCRRILNNGS